MRIRSIKPEFWRSDDITSLDWEARLIFIGLWSYVDDNGVGVDKLSAIAADLFAGDLERDPSETFARVSRGLQTLGAAGRIARYEAEGKRWLSITNWSRHQRIDKPNKPRYPQIPGLIGDSGDSREGVASISRESSDRNRGTEEQGSRGTGEQDSSSDALGADVADDSKYSDEVKDLCSRLAERVRANGHKVGVVGATWWAACERMMRLDEYTAEQIAYLIEWSTADEFWSTNIRSMATLRDKASTLKAQSQQRPRGGSARQAASLSLVEKLQREESGREEVGSGEAAGVRAIRGA